MFYNKALVIWQKEDVPLELARLFNPDDLDYVACIHKDGPFSKWMDGSLPFILDERRFGCCDVDRIEYKDWILFGGYHA